MENTSNKIISIIIVTTGIKNYLWPLLDSLRQQTYPAFEIILIDNSLNPDFSSQLIKDYPEVKLYFSSKNLSYCESLNKGIEASKGYFVLCLNDDVILDKRFIEEALKGFGINDKIGMVSGKILRSNKKTIDSTGLFLSLWRTAAERGYAREDKGKYCQGEYIFGVNGAVAFYRKDMLEQIKLTPDYFDADFRFFYEDLDVAWRAQRFGWKGYYNPLAIAYHLRGGTARLSQGINKPYARRYLDENLNLDLIKNRYLTLIKNESFLSFILHFPFIFFYDALVWSYISLFKPHLIKKIIFNLKYMKEALKKRGLIAEKIRKKSIILKEANSTGKKMTC